MKASFQIAASLGGSLLLLGLAVVAPKSWFWYTFFSPGVALERVLELESMNGKNLLWAAGSLLVWTIIIYCGLRLHSRARTSGDA